MRIVLCALLSSATAAAADAIALRVFVVYGNEVLMFQACFNAAAVQNVNILKKPAD